MASSAGGGILFCAKEGCGRRYQRRKFTEHPELCRECETKLRKATARGLRTDGDARDAERTARQKKAGAKAVTVEPRWLTKAEIEAGKLIVVEEQRPRTRAECENSPRPCPWVGCRHHLAIDVSTDGSLKLMFPKAVPEGLEHLADTCALDVADRGGMGLEDCGDRLNVTRERIRQIEAKALRKLRHGFARAGLSPREILDYFGSLSPESPFEGTDSE